MNEHEDWRALAMGRQRELDAARAEADRLLVAKLTAEQAQRNAEAERDDALAQRAEAVAEAERLHEALDGHIRLLQRRDETIRNMADELERLRDAVAGYEARDGRGK